MFSHTKTAFDTASFSVNITVSGWLVFFSHERQSCSSLVSKRCNAPPHFLQKSIERSGSQHFAKATSFSKKIKKYLGNSTFFVENEFSWPRPLPCFPWCLCCIGVSTLKLEKNLHGKIIKELVCFFQAVLKNPGMKYLVSFLTMLYLR